MCIRDSQVVPLGQVAVEDLSGQATADTVGLDENECAFGHAGNLSGDYTPPRKARTGPGRGQGTGWVASLLPRTNVVIHSSAKTPPVMSWNDVSRPCLLYTSDAADD